MENSSFSKLLDEIATYLYAGVHWHMRAANYSRKNLIRGFGRWHDQEAKGDFCTLIKFEKVVSDKLGHIPAVNMEMVDMAEAYVMSSNQDFKAHFKTWENRERDFSDCLNEAIREARGVDIQIYNELICLQKEVQDEIMRARMARDSLDFGGWNPHDISVKSKWIHEYFEHTHQDGGEININLG
jgi:hypothetical protein